MAFPANNARYESAFAAVLTSRGTAPRAPSIPCNDRSHSTRPRSPAPIPYERGSIG
jgi:hypothetical protein